MFLGHISGGGKYRSIVNLNKSSSNLGKRFDSKVHDYPREGFVWILISQGVNEESSR